MDETLLSNLLGVATIEIDTRVKNVILLTASKIEYIYGRSMDLPQVKYDLRGRTAGYAVGGHTIRLNLEILNDPRYTEDMIKQTIPHEVAHIACMQFWPTENVAHGYKWQRMMVRIGLKPDRCHQYETKKARQTKKYRYTCGCSSPLMMGATRHRRMQNGESFYRCSICKERLIYSP